MRDDILTDRLATPGATTRRVNPVSFDGCFGWLHDPPAGMAVDRAVLICGGLTNDKLSAHRPFRLLADALADAGYPVLRFDYPGTGDSVDVEDADHWSLWQASIGAAIDWLRARTGATQVVLVGLRIGATLAALAAERRDDVAALVLLEPTLRGRAYLREVAVEQMVNRGRGAPVGDGLDSHGLRLSRETIRRIEAVDLRQVRPPPACRVAVHAQASSAVMSAFLDAWRASAASVTVAGFDGLAPFLRVTYLNHEGEAEIAPIVAWLQEAAPQTVRDAPLPPRPVAAPLRTDGWAETPLLFGPARRLFGMLCRPAGQVESGLAVVMLNISGHPHYGLGRLSVELARRWAAAGVASLRMDFAGIGDSPGCGGDGDVGSHVLETDREADISAALDALAALGYRRFALQGLCTGAYHALYGAVADRRVGAVALVNLPMFTWRKGDSLEMIGVRRPGDYLRSLADRDTWIRLRERRLKVVRPALAIRGAVVGWWRRVTGTLTRRPEPWVDANFGQRCLKILAGRQTRTLFFYAAGDPGLAALEQAFAPDGVPPAEAAELRIFPDMDHTLSRSAMRQIAADHIAAFLERASAA